MLVAERYEVVRPLGRGGMGEVYVAFDRRLDREIALKVLPERAQQRDERASQRFLLQARLAARVSHAATVQVFDCGVHEGIPFVVQELLVGVTVAEALAQGPLSCEAALGLTRELCRALSAVHAAGIVHRDVKPSNLFLHAPGGARRQLKLLDFGLARLLRTADGLTRTGEGFGTLSYMAPEQLTRAKGARAQADVYAIGAVLFELLSGRPPFVRPTRTELRLSVLHDPAPRLDALLADTDPRLADVIARALAKQPEQRYGDVTELLEALERLAPHAERSAHGRRPPSALTERFTQLRVLGRGAHGEVGAFLDRQTGQAVALKRVRSVDLEGQVQLRREFAVLSGLRHPNVVRVYELLELPGELALMLELIDGVPFDGYVRGALPKLYSATRQLCEALRALHGAGLAHRDLKPANVLVRPCGELVLVDFGLASDPRARGRAMGTARYLAPEAREGVFGPASDLYALGVMLRDALAALPDGPEQRAGKGELLRQLSERLRQPPPEARPSAELACTLLGAHGSVEPAPPQRAPDAFVGRLAELGALRAAYQTSLHGRVAIVSITGAAGVGKSALVTAFCRNLPRRTLVFRGENRVGVRAMDALLDQLSEHLDSLPLDQQRALLPRETGGLLAAFPVMRRVAALRAYAAERGEREQSEVMEAAHRALRTILAALSRRAPLVIVLEDVHTSEPDQLALLGQLLREPDAPSLLVVMTYQADAQLPELGALSLRATAHTIALDELAELDGFAYLRGALPEHPGLHRQLLCEGGDSFHFLTLLTHKARRDAGGAAPSLGAALDDVRAQLSPAAEGLLALVSQCQEPLPCELLLSVAQASAHDLSELEGQRLVKRVRQDGLETLVPYHARVRGALLASMPPGRRRARHALVLAMYEHVLAPAARIEHLIGAGQAEQGARLCEELAAQAERARDYAGAAALRAVALAHLPAETPSIGSLRERYAHALHCAGQSRAAAAALAPLLRGTGVIAHEQRAAELLLLSGDLQAGLALLDRALGRSGHALPKDLAGTLQETAVAYSTLSARGLSYAPRARGALDEAELALAELFLATAMSLSHIDLRGLPFVFRAAHAALDLGEHQLVLKACALLVWSSVSHFPNPLIAPALELCRTLVARESTPYERALLQIALSEFHFFAGQFLQAETASERAEHLLVSECVGVAREISGVRNMQGFLQFAHKGDFRSRADQILRWMSEAEAAGNAYQLNMLRSAHALALVAQDRPDLARAQLAAAERDWPRGVSLFEVTAVLFLDVIDRYEGDHEAHLHPAQGRASILLSPIAQGPALKGYIELQRAWGTLRAISRGVYQDEDVAMLQTALGSLRALSLPNWSAVADALDANFQLLLADTGEAIRLLERSERAFRELHMLCLAACARHRRGETTGGLVGERIRREAESELRDLGVVRVDRWCRAYFSPFTLHDAREPITMASEPPESC